MPLWQELRRRNVVKVGTAYLAVAWLVTQVVSSLNDPLSLPERFDTIVVVLLAVGFPIALIIAWAFELTPDGIRRTDPASASRSRASAAAGYKLNYFITAVLAIAVVFLFVDRFMLGSAPDAAGPAAQDSSQIAESRNTSRDVGADRIGVAVLPLRTLWSEDDLASLANGLSEQLIRELKRIPELLVTDRASSFAFRDSEQPLRAIAGQLGVEHVLEGTLADDGSVLRIAVELTRVADDQQLYAVTRDFERSDIFAVQDEITEQVATALEVSLGVLEERRPGMTRNIEAYEEYLIGLGDAQRFTPASLRSAISRQQRAIALDPEFFLARVALYFAYTRMSTVVAEDDAAAARASASETLALLRAEAPDAREVATIDAIRNLTGRNWAEVEAFLASRQGRSELAADDIGLNASLGAFLHRVGRPQEALRYLETARALAPVAPELPFMLGSAYAAVGDLGAARVEYERGLDLNPDSTLVIGATLILALAARDRDELVDRIAANDAIGPMWKDLVAVIDDPDAGIAEVRRRFEEGVEDTPLDNGLLAHWANFFGAPELALEIMHTLPLDAAWLPLMLWDPGMVDARKLPAFNELAGRLELVDYWREYGWPDYCRPLGDDFVCE